LDRDMGRGIEEEGHRTISQLRVYDVIQDPFFLTIDFLEKLCFLEAKRISYHKFRKKSLKSIFFRT